MRIHQMMTRSLLAASVASGAMMTASASYAAAAANETAGEVREVIVTATKKEEKLHDVALAISAITGDDMNRRVQPDFRDLASQVPGLTVTQTATTLNRLTIRGENADGGGATVGIIIDDMPFSYNSGEGDGSITTTNIGTYDMERVEVLRGPQGTLYGAGAEGGLLKYVTAKPKFTGFDAGIEGGLQQVEHGQAAANVKGFVNIPLSDTLAIRAMAYDEVLPGWVNNWATGQKAYNHGLRAGGRFTVLWAPTKDLTVTAQVATQEVHSGGSAQVTVYGAALTPFAPPANAQQSVRGFSIGSPIQAVQKNPTSYAYVNVAYDLHFAKVTSITSYGVEGNRFQSDSTGAEIAPGLTYATYLGHGAPAGVLAPFAIPPVYNQDIYVNLNNPFKLHKYTEEIRFSSEPDFKMLGLPVEWQFGGMATREMMNWSQYANAYATSAPNGPPISPSAGFAELNSPYNEQAYFGDATVHFTPKLDAEFGIRTSEISQRSQINLHCCVLFGPADQALKAIRINANTTTWSFAPRYHLDKDTVVYARVATGFRPGGPVLQTPGAPSDFPTKYNADSTINYETGLRTYLFDKTVSIDVAAYYISWKDVQIITLVQTSQGPFGVEGNGGAAKSRGIEWNLGWNPIPGLQLGLVGDVDDAELTKDATSYGGKSGDVLSSVPDFVNTVNIDYTAKAFGGYDYFVGGSWTYTDNSKGSFVSPTAAAVVGNRVSYPSYSMINMQGGIQNNKYTVEFFVHNLFDDKTILSYANSGSSGPNSNVYGTPTSSYGSASFLQPRTIGFRVAAKY